MTEQREIINEIERLHEQNRDLLDLLNDLEINNYEDTLQDRNRRISLIEAILTFHEQISKLITKVWDNNCELEETLKGGK